MIIKITGSVVPRSVVDELTAIYFCLIGIASVLSILLTSALITYIIGYKTVFFISLFLSVLEAVYLFRKLSELSEVKKALKLYYS